MPTFAELFQSSENPETLHARLEAAGFVEIKEAAPKAKSTFVKPARKSTFTQSAPQRAEKLLRSLASNEDETKVLSSCIDELIQDLRHSADPMRALLNLSRFSDAVADRAAFLFLLSTNAKVRKRLCHLLAFSQAVAETLLREPGFISQLEDDIVPPSRAQLRNRIRKVLDSRLRGNDEEIDHGPSYRAPLQAGTDSVAGLVISSRKFASISSRPSFFRKRRSLSVASSISAQPVGPGAAP